jgi:outer membrane protein assembly factor BamA
VAIIRMALSFLLFMGTGNALAVFGENEETGEDVLLGEIIVEGNERTDTGVILRELGFEVGDPFDYELLDQAWDRLEDIGYFAFVDMEYDQDDSGQMVLRVIVEEDMSTSYGPLLRYSPRHKYLLGAWVAENNLRGKGEVLKLELAALYIQRAVLSWQRPWLFGHPDLEAKVSLRWQSAPFVYRPTSYRQWQTDLEARWTFQGPMYLRGGINFGQDDYRDDYSWPATDPDLSNVEYLAHKETRTALTAAVGIDTRSNPWYPRQGVFIEAGAHSWQSDQFESYTETFADARFFVPLPVGKHTLALRAFGRRTDGSAHLDNVLFYGGAETIRGYRLGRLEGDEGYLLSVEYRIPLFIMPISPKGEMVGFGLHAFGDAGDAWWRDGDPQQALQSYGGGAHLNLDRLQLRFEAARTRDGDWSFEFMDQFNF